MKNTLIVCVICGEPARFKADAKYKSGIVEEPLCEKCAITNEEIRGRKV